MDTICKFTVGQIIHHVLFNYRGVIVDIDSNFQGTETWYREVAKSSPPRTGYDKTSLVAASSDDSGSLLQLLQPLAEAGISMTRIESRPSQHNNWEYIFYLDLNGHIKDQSLKKANEEIKKEASLYRFLGSYPAALKK